MRNADDVRLPVMHQELREDDYDVLKYRAFQEAARDGVYPAHLRNGQWYANRSDKPAIIAALRLKRRRAAPQHAGPTPAPPPNAKPATAWESDDGLRPST